MKDYINDTFDDIEADLYAVLGRINALRMDVDGGQSIPAVKREWVSLTDEEVKSILDCGRGGLVDIKKTEQLLKERNNG